ncbi:MAG: SdrD B-like domain-containing protein [Moraxellaceae bacterium]
MWGNNKMDKMDKKMIAGMKQKWFIVLHMIAAAMALFSLIFLVIGNPAHALIQRSFKNLSFEDVQISSTAPCRVYASSDATTPSASVPGWTTTHPSFSGGGRISCAGTVSAGVDTTSIAPIIEVWKGPRFLTGGTTTCNNNSQDCINGRSGNQFVELNAESLSEIRQQVCLETGESVGWKFSHNGRNATADQMRFKAGSQSIIRVATSTTGSGNVLGCDSGTCNAVQSGRTTLFTKTRWADYSGSFTANNSTNTYIGFESLNGSSTQGNFLDDIQVTLKPAVEFKLGTYSQVENQTAPTVDLQVVGIVQANISLNLTIDPTSTAVIGTDYTLNGGTSTSFNITLPAGDYSNGTVISIPVTLLNNSIVEGSRFFKVILTPDATKFTIMPTSSCTNTGGNASSTFAIQDDDIGLQLEKSWVNASVNDKATLTTTGGGSGASNISSVVTANTATETDTSNTIILAAGASRTLSETLNSSNSGAYSVSGWTCNGGSLSGSVLTTSTADYGKTIKCTITNSRTTSLQLAKAWGAGSSVSDSATIGATTGGTNNTSAFTTIGGTNATSGTPVAIATGNTITFPAETGTNIAGYNSVLSCTANNGATANALSGTNGQVSNTLLIGAGDAGKAIVCTYSNTRKSTTFRLAKAWGANSITNNVANLNATTGLINNTAAFTSTASTATNGATVTVFAGETATLPAETMSSGTLANYNTVVSCNAGTLSGTNGQSSGNTLTVTAAATATAPITCTYTNTRIAQQLSVAKTWQNAINGHTASATTTGGTNNASVSSTSTGNNTTTGTPVTVYAGDVVNLPTETLGGGALPVQYNSALACSGGTTLASGAMNRSITITANTTATVCTYTNTFIVSGAINGRVFEDSNYGGGAGRSYATSSGSARSNARVELYDSSGNFVTSATTDASGNYSFTGLAAGNYTVRVVNSSVTSSRGTGGLAVQTFRANATTGIAVADTNRVGGETPSLVDAGNGTTTLASLTTATTTAQSVAPVTVALGTITGVDFGYNFSTIVNTNDLGQGSLRQFIINTNTLSDGLAQSGSSNNTRGASSSLPSGRDSTIFMIPDGASHAGIRSGLTNQLTGGVAIIKVASSLPAITGGNTLIDGGTQTFNIGNSNTTTLNSASTVGIDNLSVPAIAGPEVQIEPTSGFYASTVNGLTLSSNDNTVQNISISGFTGTGGTDQGDIYVSAGATGTLIRWNTVGITATSYSDRGAGVRTTDYGIYSLAGSLTVRENIVAYVGAGGIELFNVSSILVEANELRGNAIINSSAENVNVNSGSGLTARGNLSRDAGGPGFDTSGSSGGNLFENNSVINNGRLETGQNSGLRINGTNNTIRKNIITQNHGAGVLVRSGSTGNLITQNSTYANGTTGTVTKQLGIDLTSGSDSQNTGTAPFVTVNDANDSDSGGNNLLNFPVFESITISGANLVLKGCAPAGASIELFEADVSPGKAVSVGSNTNAPRTLDYGEGQTYLTTLTEGVSDTDSGTNCPALDGNDQTGMSRFAFSVAVPSGVAVGDLLTTTATVSSNTSEFSPVVRASNAPTLTKAFNPTSIIAGQNSVLTITLANSNTVAATLTGSLADNLPANVTIADLPNATTTCTGGAGVTAVTGQSVVTLASGAVIPANNSCTVSVKVTSTVAGIYTNTIAAGALRTTVGDNLLAATDDLTVNSLVAITGRVFNDNGGTDPVPATVIANAYNGTQNTGELGIAGSTVRLTNCAANPAPADVLATTQTDAAGDYRFGIVASQLSSPFCVTQTNLAGDTSVSGTGDYTRATDTIEIANTGAASYTDHDFGDARLNLVLTSDGQQTTTPSGTVSYPHVLRSEAVLDVDTLNTLSSENPTLGWTTILYRDDDCDGTIDAGELALTSAIGQLLPNQEICVVQRVNAPANASNGAQHVATLSASYTATVQDSGVLSGSSNTRTDTTLVGTAGLDMRKQVRVVASCPSTGADVAAFTERNTAKNGDFLEYEIIYSNRSTRNLSQLTVRDVAPSSTTFKSAACQSTPSGSSCTAPVTAGVNGDLAWSLANIAPAATGSVRFCVQVPPLAAPPIK